MSYTISPIPSSEKVTYEVQILSDAGEWKSIDGNINDIEEATRKLCKSYNSFKEKEFRLIQRTESVALVVREV